MRGRGRATTTAALKLDLGPTIVCMGLLPARPRQDDLGPTLKICSPILPCRTSFQAAPIVGSAPDSKHKAAVSQEIPCLRKAVTKGEKTPSHARSSDLRKIASDLRLQETSNRRNHESARHLSVTGARPPLSYFPLAELHVAGGAAWRLFLNSLLTAADNKAQIVPTHTYLSATTGPQSYEPTLWQEHADTSPVPPSGALTRTLTWPIAH